MLGAVAVLAAVVVAGCATRQDHTAQAHGTTSASNRTASSTGQHTIVIRGENMEPTFHSCRFSPDDCTADRVLFTNLADYAPGVHRGMIIEFRAPGGWNDEPGVGVLLLISRVVATGGETVKGDASGHVLISKHGDAGPWTTLNEPYVYTDGTDDHAAFGPVTVPIGRVWVMGDHRNDSADSRFHCGPSGPQGTDGPECDPMSSTIPVSDVVAVATRIVAPSSRVRLL
jgi:signal peptidase I